MRSAAETSSIMPRVESRIRIAYSNFSCFSVAIVMSLDYLAAEKQEKFEYALLILLSTLGMMLLVSAADLIALYLGLELMSLALYVLAAIQRDNVRAAE